jgi:hypothetical protein
MPPTVSIDPGTVQELRDHRKRQVAERLRVSKRAPSTPGKGF